MPTTDQILGFLAVGCLLGLLGEGVIRAVGRGRTGWRGLYHRTIFAHPVAVGALMGLHPKLPAPAGLRVVWYAVAGGLGAIIYKGVRGFLEARAARAVTGEVPK